MYGVVDIGGTKTLVAVFDMHGKIIEKQKFPTNLDYSQFVTDLAQIVDKLTTKDFLRIGVAIPGKPDRAQGIGIAFGNLPWRNVPIQVDLENIFHTPVIIENDSKLAGLSEAHALKDKKFKKVLYVTISTGISGAYIVDGKIDPNLQDMEPGHNLLERGERLMRWQEFASGKAIVKKFGKQASDITDAKDWYIIARNIAIGLIDLIATLTPDVIILGGGVSNHFEKFEAQLNEQLKIYEHPLLSIPPIRKAARPDEAVIYGCYELAKARYAADTGRA